MWWKRKKAREVKPVHPLDLVIQMLLDPTEKVTFIPLNMKRPNVVAQVEQYREWIKSCVSRPSCRGWTDRDISILFEHIDSLRLTICCMKEYERQLTMRIEELEAR